MAETQQNLHTGTDAPVFRIDQKLHQILYKQPARPKLEPMPEEVLPEPPYPQHPNPRGMTKREYHKMNRIRTWKSWCAPYFKSPSHSTELRPLIPDRFTRWKCTLDRHYSWS